MRHNLRRAERFPLAGNAQLIAGEERIAGRIIDISLNGVALAIDEHLDTSAIIGKVWLCQVDSDDLPAPVEFLVKVVRRRSRAFGTEIGGEIRVIDARPLGMLKAFRALSRARDALVGT